MTRTSTTTLAVAADYADALITARRAKNALFLLLSLIVLLQLAGFLLVRFKTIRLDDRAGITATTAPPATAPADTSSAMAPTGAAPQQQTRTVSVADVFRYAIPVTNFLGVTLVLVLAVVLLLLVTIMLVGRLVGVSHVTGAFIWCVVLAVFLFPWQSFLITHEKYSTVKADGSVVAPPAPYSASDPAMEVPPQPAFKVPGVLYTYPELLRDFDFPNSPPVPAGLNWARYVGFPVLALLILLMVQTKSARGMRFALGEADMQVEVTTRSADQLT